MMINIRELKNDHSGEVFLALGYSEKINRQVLIACMPKVWEWQEDASKELKKNSQGTLFQGSRIFQGATHK